MELVYKWIFGLIFTVTILSYYFVLYFLREVFPLWNYLFSRLDYKKECEKNNIGYEEITKIEKLQKKYEIRWALAILFWLLLIYLYGVLNGYNFWHQFDNPLKNLQFISIIFGSISVLFMSLNVFISKYQIAWESAFRLGVNDALQENLIKQKYAYR